MTKIIGLTGGIGSGKTTVAKEFEALGVPIYIADAEAKKIMDTPEVMAAIKNTFGHEIFKNGKPDKAELARLVFENPGKLQQLNKIIHPEVKKHFDQWVKMNAGFPFVIKEAAILFESGSYKDCDKIITVTAPIEERIQRVIQRDKTDYESVLKRIKNQWTDEMRAQKSDYIIENSNLPNTKKQVKEVYAELANL